MSKRGIPFEQATAEVIRAIDPHAKVRQGEWMNGPDGRRDRDVHVEATVNGAAYRVLIECKDYNPQATGPVGINPIDALESKRRDMNVDLAVICSNAGFTAPAIRKGKRCGIPLIGVFRRGDSRIKYQVCDEVYFRRLKIEHLGFRLERHDSGTKTECRDGSVTYLGHPIANWVCHHARMLITTNPISAGHYAGTYEFTTPVAFTSTNGEFVATHLFSEFILSGGWYSQIAYFDGLAGIYDFIRKRISVGFRSYEVQIKDMDLTAGTPIDYPPSSALDPSVGTNPGEFWVQFLYLIDAKCNQPVPPLDSIIIERDLKPDIEGLPPSLQARGKLDPRMSTSFFQCENPKVGPQHSFTFHSK